MILVRLAKEQSADSLPTRFADPQAQYDATDRIIKVTSSLGQYPGHVELQRSFAKLVGQRDQLEQRLLSCS